jgi:serine/threonine-protein kinase
MVAYVAAAGSQAPQLIVRTLASGTDRIIGDPLGPRHPFFSPDGQWIAFFSGNAIRKISLADGRSQTLARATLPQTGWWGHGFVLFGAGGDLPSVGISRVPENSGTVEVLTRPDKAAGEFNHFSPQLLPDGLTLMYSARTPYGPYPRSRVMLKPPDRPARMLLDDAHSAQYVGNSRLIYQQGQSLFVTHLDLETMTVSGRGELLFDDASTDGRPRWTVAGGILVYRSLVYRSQNDNRQLVWVNREGQEVALPAPPRSYAAPALSPGGDRVAVEIEEEGKFDIWTLDPRRPTLRQVTFDGASRYPIWSPDGKHIGVVSRSQNRLYWVTPDGRDPQDLVRSKFPIWFGSWTSDMRTLVFMEEREQSRSDIWAVNPGSHAPPRPIVQTNAREYGGRVSPDDKWVTFFSDESGQFQLFLTRLDAVGQPQQISSGDARARTREAVWARNRRELELFYRQGPAMFSVRVPGDGRPPQPPTQVFEGDYFATGGPGIVNFDVTSDDRFLMLKPVENQTPHLTVVQGLDRLIGERFSRTAR